MILNNFGLILIKKQNKKINKPKSAKESFCTAVNTCFGNKVIIIHAKPMLYVFNIDNVTV